MPRSVKSDFGPAPFGHPFAPPKFSTPKPPPAPEADYMPRPNSGVMFNGVDMTQPLPTFLDHHQDWEPPRKPSPGSVISGLASKKAIR